MYIRAINATMITAATATMTVVDAARIMRSFLFLALDCETRCERNSSSPGRVAAESNGAFTFTSVRPARPLVRSRIVRAAEL